MSAGSLRRTRTMAEGNGARGACSLRQNCTLAEGDRAEHTGSLRRYCTVRICNGRRESPWSRNRGKLCCVIGQVGSRYTSILRNRRRSPRQCCRRTVRVWRSTVEVSFTGAKGTWLARVRVSAQVEGSPKAHSGSSSGSRRGGRGWDTTMVVGRERVSGVTAVTVYLALVLVVPSRLI